MKKWDNSNSKNWHQRFETFLQKGKSGVDATAGSKDLISSRKAYFKEVKKVVDAADVLIEVLDARDPLGTRCIELEKEIMSSGGQKKLVLLLNKIGMYIDFILLCYGFWLNCLYSES